MSISLTQLNYHDVCRIIDDFDQEKFKTPKAKRATQIEQAFVYNRFERLLRWERNMPVNIIDMVMRRYLDASPSVGALLAYYRGSPALHERHPLPLGNEEYLLHKPSALLLKKLGEVPQKGPLASYKQLMTLVFKYHFQNLNLEQKLELITRSNITPWEQKTASEKLTLLGRVHTSTVGGQVAFKLQLLSWKIQFAVARILQQELLTTLVKGVLFTVLGVWFLFGIVSLLLSVPRAKIFEPIFSTLLTKWIAFHCYGLIAMGAGMVLSLFTACFGLTLRIPFLPSSVQTKGKWIQSVGGSSFRMAFFFCLTIAGTLAGNRDNYNSNAWQNALESCLSASKDLQQLFLQSINEANVKIDQKRFIDAQLPDLIEKWLLLTAPLGVPKSTNIIK
jgi:hypothetical protein